MKIKKKELFEIIDSNGDLIGKNNIPTNGSDLESQSNKTTDYNVRVGNQPFRYDMLGRFGFTLLPFFEGKEYNDKQEKFMHDLAKLMYDKYKETLEYYYRHPNKLKSDFRLHSKNDFDSQPEDKRKIDFKWAKKIVDVVQKHFENGFENFQNIDEIEIFEDVVRDKKNEVEMTKNKNDNEIRDKQLKKIADLISKKLNKKEIGKLVNLIENKYK